ncbi:MULTISPECIES: macro domain-containing protein [Micrococcaceae]|uniref:macro domain-containing protein n=1 Tax=Micrococcaceae TaxID=1268 RepID=UPI00161D7C65|nr:MULTISPECIES: macro domain-containing protein [Micrococcaceae]MBB5748763.1 O-acetyl-ADP-ribose deacetylase (regulator of RNase III) [Micrococcus sp. TA1]HRO93390.1 macro domain-containing protein [Citricoccus sp.]
MPAIIALQGDITRTTVDAIVNAANTSLGGGAGVNGAVHAAGGPGLLAETRLWYPHGLGTGDAAWTTAGDLPARWVIHTVGPDHRSGQRDRALLVSGYRRSLEVADALGARTVAFPLLSSGIFGWPLHDAVRTAVDTIALARTDVREAYLVAHGDQAFRAVRTALGVSTPLRVLQGLRELYRRGYQQLRFAPGMDPSGAHWRIAITTAGNLRPGDPVPFDTPRDESRVLRYSTADRTLVGRGEVTAGTTPAEAAALILDRVGTPDPEPVHPRYTAWFASLIAEVETTTSATGQALPVTGGDGGHGGGNWELGRGSGHRHPAPPR